MSMRKKAEDLIEKVKRMINQIIKENLSIDSIAELDSEDLNTIREANDLMESSYELALDQIDVIENIDSRVEEIRTDVIEINRKLDIILEKMQEKEE